MMAAELEKKSQQIPINLSDALKACNRYKTIQIFFQEEISTNATLLCISSHDYLEAIFKTPPGIKTQMWDNKKGVNEPTLLVIFLLYFMYITPVHKNLFWKGWQAISKLKPLSLFISL